MEENERARAELQRLIDERREDYAGLSRLIGRNAAYIQQYIKRGSPKRLAEKDRQVLARYLGVDEALLRGSNELAKSSGPELVVVARFDIKASAGPGAFADGERPIAHLGFSRTWLKQLSGAAADELSIITVRGDSMAPTLADGDDIMIDRSSEGLRVRDGIYVLRLDDTLMVKRVALHPGSRRLTISSDNSAYPSWPNCDAESVDVIGRVVWAGRRIS